MEIIFPFERYIENVMQGSPSGWDLLNTPEASQVDHKESVPMICTGMSYTTAFAAAVCFVHLV